MKQTEGNLLTLAAISDKTMKRIFPHWSPLKRAVEAAEVKPEVDPFPDMPQPRKWQDLSDILGGQSKVQEAICLYALEHKIPDWCPPDWDWEWIVEMWLIRGWLPAYAAMKLLKAIAEEPDKQLRIELAKVTAALISDSAPTKY